MRTTDHTLELTLTGKRAAPFRVSGLSGVLKSVWRRMLNRQAIGNLSDLDDHQLLDIGLEREEVKAAMSLSFFDEPGQKLTMAARRRTNNFYRSARRD